MAITRIGPNQSINLASNITGTLPTGNGGTGATSFAPGKVCKLYQLLKLRRINKYDGTAFTNVSGLSVAITPSATSSKIFLTAQ